MNLYEKYSKEYCNIIEKEKKSGKQVDYIVKDYYWITMKFLQDNSVEPWETEKLMELLYELIQMKELKMIETIEKTLMEFLELKGIK